MLFGEKLAELRSAKGWSQHKMASQAGMQYGTYCRYEQSRRLPNLRHMARLLEALEVPFETFACCDDVKSIGKMAA